jgi:uncharacterized membrane-anchored protein YjiN (DUF445 family)
MAHELAVKDKFFTYNLSVEESFIRFKTVNTNVSIERQKCSAHIIDRFRNQLDRYMKDPLAQVQRSGSLEVKFDSTSGYVDKKGNRAKFLRSMPNQIKKLKIEEGLNCNPS